MSKTLRRTLGERMRSFVIDWSLPRQFVGQSAMGEAAKSTASKQLRPRLEQADRVGTSVCPYCAVGCGQLGSLGGATMDNEENYLIKKLFGGGLGMINIENQARI